MTMNPIEFEELYNSILLAGVRSPGSVKLSGHDRVIGWDEKKGSGQDGASVTRSSSGLAKVKCEFYLATLEEFAAWPSFDGLIRSSISGSAPKALDVYHPDLAVHGIVSVVLSSFGGVVHDGKGGQTITVEFLEYRPPKAKGGSPSGSKAKKQPDPNDPNAAALAELDRLTKEYARTPWG